MTTRTRDTLTKRERLAALVAKLQDSERKAAAELGEFTLFGLFERDDSGGYFDIIAAAPWLTSDGAGIDMIVPYLPRLASGETSLIGALVPLRPEDDFVRAATRLAPEVTPGQVFEMGGVLLADVQIARAYILASHTGAGAKPAGSLAA